MSSTLERGATVLQLWREAKNGALLYLADDDQEAEAIGEALRGLAPNRTIIIIPSSDTMPGDTAPASPANVGQRIAALRALRRTVESDRIETLIIVMSGEAAARLYPKPDCFDAALPRLEAGDKLDVSTFAQSMQALGYNVDDRVDEPGEVAVRGEVIDLFPADSGSPVRIEIRGGRIEAMRRYDPASQLTTEPVASLEIGRAAEPVDAATTAILEHVPPGRLILSPKADARRRRFIALAATSAERSGAKLDAVDEARWQDLAKHWAGPSDTAVPLSVPAFAETKSPLAALERFARPRLDTGDRLVLVGSERDLRFLRMRVGARLKVQWEDLNALDDVFALPPASGGLLIAPLDSGAAVSGLLLIAAADLLGSRALIGEMVEPASLALLRAGTDIRTGDVIVHEDHGVGRILGLERAPDDPLAEVVALEYAGGARRLVPVSEAGRIWRYGSESDAISLDRLDGASWEKRREAVESAIASDAQALLQIVRERAHMHAPVLEPEPALYERFANTFPFNETADQFRAIHSVREDLASGTPMDRLVIGDVGFGKTEVALRAAALAALSGFQVILAAPTTVLVRQHLQTFERRFQDAGIKVAGLSRLSSAAQKKAVKAGLADGSIQIVVGTAAVMAKDVAYSRLGLVIIDEEQRFGAADKAKLRGRPDVHLLVMSATPIPRTLHRAMVGLQQVSVIATPPARRQPIRTSLAALDDNLIRTMLMREHVRGGQSFVVVPRIEDIDPMSERLGRIVPELNLVRAHGKMKAADIDEAMVGFADGKGDILLATNIIEAGLDVPRANSMIVVRADRFGLAQLHQLRGRVGRGNRRGQVLLLTQGDALADRTMKRLRTLAAHDQLGAGFDISAADLDQRGAGDILSDAQTGHMKLIGVDLYQHLFEAALSKARGEDGGLWQPEVHIGGRGALPTDWIPEADLRLGLYVRLARARDEAEIDEIEEELCDRFGTLPDAAQHLIVVARIAGLARRAGIMRIDAGPAAIALTPRADRSLPHAPGLTEKNGRWLLKESCQEEERPGRILSLLETLGNAER